MALPILAALIGGLGSAASGILGAQAANNAAAYNYYSDHLNFQQRERERTDSINQAKRVEADQKLGGTDARGNRTYFKEGVGWVTELSDEQEQLSDLYQQEELAQLTQDLPMRRSRMQDNDERQDREGLHADRIMDAIMRQERQSPRDLELLMNEASMRGITEGFDSAAEDGARHALRTGSNVGKLDANIGKARASALMQALLENKINSKSMANDQYMQTQGNMANLYNMFATRSSAMPDVSFQPQNIAGQGAQQQGHFSQLAQSGAGALVNAMAKQGGSLPRVEPNYGTANAVGQIGNAFAGVGERIGAAQDKGSMQDAFMQYVFGGGGGAPQSQYGDMFKANTGTF